MIQHVIAAKVIGKNLADSLVLTVTNAHKSTLLMKPCQ